MLGRGLVERPDGVDERGAGRRLDGCCQGVEDPRFDRTETVGGIRAPHEPALLEAAECPGEVRAQAGRQWGEGGLLPPGSQRRERLVGFEARRGLSPKRGRIGFVRLPATHDRDRHDPLTPGRLDPLAQDSDASIC